MVSNADVPGASLAGRKTAWRSAYSLRCLPAQSAIAVQHCPARTRTPVDCVGAVFTAFSSRHPAASTGAESGLHLRRMHASPCSTPSTSARPSARSCPRQLRGVMRRRANIAVANTHHQGNPLQLAQAVCQQLPGWPQKLRIAACAICVCIALLSGAQPALGSTQQLEWPQASFAGALQTMCAAQTLCGYTCVRPACIALRQASLNLRQTVLQVSKSAQQHRHSSRALSFRRPRVHPQCLTPYAAALRA